MTGVRYMHKWALALKVLPLVGLVVAAKALVHVLGYETVELNALFTSMVAGAIFLLGFLISGVLSDYREAEKIPGDVAVSLETLYDDGFTAWKSKDLVAAKDFLNYHKELTKLLDTWFYKREHTQKVLEAISGMNEFFVSLEQEGAQPNLIVHMKNEQAALRRLVTRIHTIRDTDFVPSVYAIVEFLALAVSIGMVFVKIQPFFESLLFAGLVSYLFCYMIMLIRDLDNPFDYSHNGENGTEVSLKPFHDVVKRLHHS